ncbi:MAG: transcriptional regulator [Actinomycetota bacterium]|jgi:hypothetical protein|nr:transcriptional regulator [Actinomycetota bacterium]
MAQMTWRTDSELTARVRSAAERQHRSMNEYVTAVLDAATDPDMAGTEAERLHERLAAAGLLSIPEHQRTRPPAAALAHARRKAGTGTPLSVLVSEGR